MKGGGQGQAISKAEVNQAADAILQPLMDLLDGMHSPTIDMTPRHFVHRRPPVASKFTFLFMPYLNVIISNLLL